MIEILALAAYVLLLGPKFQSYRGNIAGISKFKLISLIAVTTGGQGVRQMLYHLHTLLMIA